MQSCCFIHAFGSIIVRLTYLNICGEKYIWEREGMRVLYADMMNTMASGTL